MEAPLSPVVPLLSLLLAGPDDPLVTHVRQTAYARMDLARSMARDVAIAGFVAAKNASPETEAQVRERDARWQVGGETALRRSITSGPCADRLRQLVQDDPFVLEALLMDVRGALVCATNETSDYWQGDEAKWTKPMVDGAEAFVDQPAFDESTAAYAIQISVPVLRERARIGALCLTLKVPRPSGSR